MTGGGFGGCTVTLVERDSVLTLEKFISKEYKERTGKDCSCFQCIPSVGCGVYELVTAVEPAGNQRLLVSAVVVAVFAFVAYHIKS